MNKSTFHRQIASNIANSQIHITLVQQSYLPRYAYTIGLYPDYKFELIFAGGYLLSNQQVFSLINYANQIIRECLHPDGVSFTTPFGEFQLASVGKRWSENLMIGVSDYYQLKCFNAFQIIPSKERRSIEIPDMSIQLNSKTAGCWRFLIDAWEYSIPKLSTVLTDLDVLMGKPVVELVRVEEDQWEMFSGPGFDFEKSNLRIIPIGVLLEKDITLRSSLTIPVDKGLYRNNLQHRWKDWG